MTPQRAKKLLPVIQAYAEGKTVQISYDDGRTWEDLIEPEFDSHGDFYRIKPSKVWRPWKPEEVPVGCLIKNQYLVSMIISATYTGVITCGHITSLNLQELFTDWKHSTDGGKTWLPCGVEEASNS